MTRTSEIFRFYRENGNWYVHLPGFLRDGGSKDDLRMRDGAGSFLDHAGGEDDEVVMEISDDFNVFEPEWLAVLQRERDMNGGGDYLVYDTLGNVVSTVWMSPPLRFYYGKYPDKFLLRRRRDPGQQ